MQRAYISNNEICWFFMAPTSAIIGNCDSRIHCERQIFTFVLCVIKMIKCVDTVSCVSNSIKEQCHISNGCNSYANTNNRYSHKI